MENATEPKLTPTLWKTCRVFANAKRVRLFRLIHEADGPVIVSAVRVLFGRTRISLGTTSLYLKHMQARGLLRAQRHGVNVFYSVRPDPKVAQAADMLRIVEECFRLGWSDTAIATFLNSLRNPGCINVVRVLHETADWTSQGDVASRLGLPFQTFCRYRDALLVATLVERRSADGRLRLPRHPLPPVRDLLALAQR